MANAKRDDNRVPTLLALSSADGTTPVTLWADPTTHRLLVSVGGSLDGLSDVTITSAAQGDILYHNGTAWVNLAAGTSGKYLKTQGAGANPTWDTPTASAGGTDTQVQFNDGGTALGGDAGFTYNKTTDTATLGALVTSKAGLPLKGTNSTDSASVQGLVIEGDRATPADNDEVYISANLSNDGAITSATQKEFARLTVVATDVSEDSEDGAVLLGVMIAGTLTNKLRLEGSALTPSASDGTALGTGTLMWADLFLASGGIINFNNGDVTITHSAGLLTISTPISLGTTNAITLGSIEVGHASDTTITRVSAGQIAVEGVNVIMNGGALGTPSSGTLTNCTGLPATGLVADTTTALGIGTIELGHASDTTISRVSAGVIAVEGVNVILNGGALGTPASGTLTNCTGLPIAGLAASTSTAIGVGSIELGHASDTTIARVSAGVISVEGVTVLTTAGGTLTGNINLGEGQDPADRGIVVDGSLSADERYSGITVAATAGATLAFGDICYLDVTATEWLLADASAASTSGNVPLGICVDASTDGNATSMLLIGTVRSAAFPASVALGAPLYVSETAGDITATAPTTTDSVMRRVGWAITAEPNTIYFNPSNDYVTHT